MFTNLSGDACTCICGKEEHWTWQSHNIQPVTSNNMPKQSSLMSKFSVATRVVYEYHTESPTRLDCGEIVLDTVSKSGQMSQFG